MHSKDYVKNCDSKLEAYIAKRQRVCAKRLALAMDIVAKTVKTDVISRETIEMALELHHDGREYSKPTFRK